MLQSWDGKTERRKHADDHDTLIALLEILDSHVKNFNIHVGDYKEHLKDDNINFKDISKQISALSKYIYIGVGVIVALDALPKIIETIKVVTH